MNEPVSAETLRAKAAMPPVDPNVTLPRSVRDQGKRAEIIQQSLVGAAEPSIANPPPNAQPPSTPPAPNGHAQDPPVVVAPPASPTPPPAAPASATPAVPVVGQPQEPQEPDDWENRFKSMKGRFDRLMEQTSQMADMIRSLQVENAGLRSAQPPPPQPGAPPPASLITEQELQDYGPEFIDVVRRAATEIAAPLHEEINRLRGQMGSVAAESGNSFLTRMHSTIAGLVPNWQEINRDQRFIAWVQLPDMFSGAIRQSLMQEAWNSGDANRVAAFFRAFLAEEAAVDPHHAARAQPPVPAAPAPVAAVPGVNLGTRLSLDQLAAPGRAQSSAQRPADKPVYTAQDITRFYTDVAAGKWRTREAERAAIDADIIAAQHEGRIIPDQRTVRPMDWNGNR